MKYSLRVKPGSRREVVEQVDASTLLVHVHTLPVAGKANDAVIRILAKYFGVTKSRVRIISGVKSKRKIVEIG